MRKTHVEAINVERCWIDIQGKRVLPDGLQEIQYIRELDHEIGIET
jgi:hypothetical protein